MRLAGCAEFDVILGKARFEMPAARDVAPTFEQVGAFIKAAHDMNRPSMALAAALASDTALRQTDVIGKWVPVAEGGKGSLGADNETSISLRTACVGPWRPVARPTQWCPVQADNQDRRQDQVRHR